LLDLFLTITKHQITLHSSDFLPLVI